jgi:hypothetical protein
MGRKNSWLRKARGYFDNKPGKLAACPPEIRTVSNAAQAYCEARGLDSARLVEFPGAAPSVELSGTTFGKPPRIGPEHPTEPVSGQSSVSPSGASSGITAAKRYGQPSVKLSEPGSVPATGPRSECPSGKPPRELAEPISGQLSVPPSVVSPGINPGKQSGQPSVDPSEPGSLPTSPIPGLQIRVHGDAIRVWRTGEPAPELAPGAQEVAQDFLTWLERKLPARRWVQVCELELLYDAHRATRYHDQTLVMVLRELKKLTKKKQKDVSPTERSRIHYLVGPAANTA